MAETGTKLPTSVDSARRDRIYRNWSKFRLNLTMGMIGLFIFCCGSGSYATYSDYLPIYCGMGMVGLLLVLSPLRKSWRVRPDALVFRHIWKRPVTLRWEEVTDFSRSLSGSNWVVVTPSARLDVPVTADTDGLLSQIASRVPRNALARGSRPGPSTQMQSVRGRVCDRRLRSLSLLSTLMTLLPFAAVAAELLVNGEAQFNFWLGLAMLWGLFYWIPLWSRVRGHLQVSAEGVSFRQGKRKVFLRWEDVVLIERRSSYVDPHGELSLLIVGRDERIRFPARENDIQAAIAVTARYAPNETAFVGFD